MKKSSDWIFQPQNIFLIFSLLIGIIMVFITPIGAGFDEDTHIARIWEISQFKFIPNQLLGQGPNFPQVFYELSYRQKEIIHPIGIDFYKDNIDLKIDWNNMINHQTRSFYFPLVYIPQAFIMGLFGRLLDAPVIVLYFLLRLSYLFLYVVLVYLAIKIIPFGKNTLALLAFAPMALIQTSIVSPDAISNGISFLFIAWIFYLCKQKGELLSKTHICITWLMVGLLASAKINSIPLILLLAFVPQRFFNNKKEFVRFWLVNILITLIICVGWNFISLLNLGNEGKKQNIFTFDRLLEIQANGSLILYTFWSEIKIHILQYYKEWVGVFGYEYWKLPTFVYILYPALLIITSFCEKNHEIIHKWNRVFMVIVFVMGFFFIILIFQILVTTNDDFSLSGIQGRYFIPLAPLLLFALIPAKPVLKINDRHKMIGLISSFSFLGITLIISTLLVYHVNCGSSYYQKGLCYLPKYKNWAPGSTLSEPMKYEQIFEQTFEFECSPVKEIWIWINPKINNQEKINIKLTGQDLKNTIQEEINISELDEAGWVIIPMPDFSPALNTPYHLFIQNVGNEEGIQLGLSLRDEYNDGVLTINEEPANYDLLFEYGCSINK